MRVIRLGAAALLGLMLLAAAPDQAAAGAGETCSHQAAVAERGASIPEGLLLAIGKRESGRYDADAGRVLPWPWAVNREGEGHLFASREEAIAYVSAALRAGTTSIDVGCFQINLKFHPTAFASLDEAFDPAANAAYAARFMTELHDRTRNWETAVAYYHSANPLFGNPYREAVLATWHGEQAPEAAGQIRTALSGSLQVIMGIRIWVPSTSAAFVPVSATRRGAFPAASRPGASGSGISGPGAWQPGQTLPGPTLPSRTLPSRTLPRVFTPSVVVAQVHG